MSALALAIALTGAIVVFRQRGASRVALLGYLILLVALPTAWVGIDIIGPRFSAADWGDVNGRRGAWSDAAAIASKFPLVGTGLNTYGVATVLYQRHDLDHHYNEAHNDYLQLAAEGGALVLAPVVIALGCFVATGQTALFAGDMRHRVLDSRRRSQPVS